MVKIFESIIGSGNSHLEELLYYAGYTFDLGGGCGREDGRGLCLEDSIVSYTAPNGKKVYPHNGAIFTEKWGKGEKLSTFSDIQNYVQQ